MLFSGKFGAAESPSAAFMGLKRGPVPLLLGRFAGRRTHSGAIGALSDVSSARRFTFFFERMLIRIVLRLPRQPLTVMVALPWCGSGASMPTNCQRRS